MDVRSGIDVYEGRGRGVKPSGRENRLNDKWIPIATTGSGLEGEPLGVFKEAPSPIDSPTDFLTNVSADVALMGFSFYV